jgi:hypothetical protein
MNDLTGPNGSHRLGCDAASEQLTGTDRNVPGKPSLNNPALTVPSTAPTSRSGSFSRELNEAQKKLVAKKRGWLLAVRDAFAKDYALRTAALSGHVSKGELSKLLALAPAEAGDTNLAKCDWLLAAPDSALVAKRKESGRKDEWAFLLDQPEPRQKLLEIYVATMGASSARAAEDRRTAKLATALEQFAHEPECPAELAARLRVGFQPASFKKFLRKSVTPEVEARVRGSKHYQLYGQISRRDWTARLPDGSRCDIPAAYTLSADDMSANHPHWVEFTDSPILTRQGLYFLWARYKVWQSVDLVARPRESYTAADVLRAFYKTCMAAGGVPRAVEFEQGIWKARLISGWRFESGWLIEESVRQEGLSDADWSEVETGLALCGVKVLYKHNAHHKHIEANFNPLQDVLAVVARQYQCIGRYAGEFERPGKQLRRVRAGSHHPRDLGFAHQSEMAECILEAFQRINSKLIDGQQQTRWEAHLADLEKVPLLPLSPRLFAACLPGQPRPATVVGGKVTVTIRGEPFDFRDDLLQRLGDGYRVGVKVDETDPNLGAAIFNATPQGNSANWDGWKLNEFLCSAAREIPGPKIHLESAPEGVAVRTVEQLYGAGAVDLGDSARRKAGKFVSTQFRAIARHGLPGQPAIRSASARDGKGNVVTIERGGASTRGTDAAAPLPLGSDPAALLPRARRSASPFTPATPEQFDRQQRRMERLARASAIVAEEQPA